MFLVGCPTPLQRARVALEEGEIERAIEILEALSVEHPQEPGVWLSLGRAQMSASHPIAARAAFERAAQLLPDRAAPRILIGHTHELERHYDEAEIAYTQACSLEPGAPRPSRVLGLRLLRWGRAREALPHLERAAALAPDHAGTWNALALAQLHSGDGVAALATFERARADRVARGLPFDRGLAIGHAALFVRARRWEPALELYDAVIVHEPRYAPAHIGRGLMLHELGRCTEAREAFRRSVRAAGDTLEAQARALEYEEGPARRCVQREVGAVDAAPKS